MEVLEWMLRARAEWAHTGLVVKPDSREAGTRMRPYREADREAVYDICVRTAAAGEGLQGRFSTDDVLGDVSAGPYLRCDPSLATTLVQDGAVVGYLVGTADTRSFADWYEEEWLPMLKRRYSQVDPSTLEGAYVGRGLSMRRLRVPEMDDYPAHLHMNILPPARGQGLGRAMLASFAAQVTDRGVSYMHVTMSPRNAGARRFYERLGFTPLPSSSEASVLLGCEIARLPPPPAGQEHHAGTEECEPRRDEEC